MRTPITKRRDVLTAGKFSDLQQWASASLELLEALAEVLPAAEALEATWQAMEADLGDEDTEAVLQGTVEAMVRRLNAVLGQGFFPDGGYNADKVREVAMAVAGLRRTFGLGAPALPAAKPPSLWWRELREDGTPKFLFETEMVQRNNMRFPSHWKLACDDWRFDVDDAGGLVRAVRK
jgi:hypothetical protein